MLSLKRIIAKCVRLNPVRLKRNIITVLLREIVKFSNDIIQRMCLLVLLIEYVLLRLRNTLYAKVYRHLKSTST